jgi:hypothetical protein
MSRITFEIKYGIDHVFQHSWPGNSSIFGDMANQEGREAIPFGLKHQLSGTFANLADAAGCLIEIAGKNRLD